MNRIAKHIAAGSFLLGVGGISVSACVHDDSTLFVKEVLAPPTVMLGMGCFYTNDPTQAELSYGILDVDFRDSYSASFLVGNQMVNQGDPTKPATETSRIKLTGGIVRITDTSGNEIKKFSQATAGTVDPLSGSNPGYLPVVEFPLVDVATVAGVIGTISGPGRPAVELDTYVRFYGYTLGGQYVESDEFEFPVEVCRGCLLSFSTTSTNTNFPQPNCLGNGTSSSTVASVPCNLEDFAIDCSVCANAGNPDCSPNAGSAPLDAGAG